MTHPISFLKAQGIHLSACQSDVSLLMPTGGMAEAMVLKDHALNWGLHFDNQGHMWVRVYAPKMYNAK